MGLTKADLFTEEQNVFSSLAKALAHPARVAILQYLLKANSCINTNLVKELGLSQPTISQHLKELKDIGIIQGTIDGTSMNYCIDPKKWMELKNVFNTLFDQHPCCSEGECC